VRGGRDQRIGQAERPTGSPGLGPPPPGEEGGVRAGLDELDRPEERFEPRDVAGTCVRTSMAAVRSRPPRRQAA
jgi:hypothetical protein